MSRLIRYANLKDSDILGKIHSESSKAAFKGIITDYILDEVFSVSRRTKRFITELTEGQPRTAIIFEEDAPAGFISFGKPRYGDNDETCIEVWRVYLAPKFWGSGVAKELIEWGIDEILKENFTNIEFWVLEKNLRARNFYEKLGFNYDNTFQITSMGKELHYVKS